MEPLAQNITVIPWLDATTEISGFAARSEYVEWFWLPVLGPSATWLIRRINHGFDEFPNGYVLDVHATARALGIAGREDAGSIFTRTLARLQTFGLAQSLPESLAVRRLLPRVSPRQVERMPLHLRQAHGEWLRHRARAV